MEVSDGGADEVGSEGSSPPLCSVVVSSGVWFFEVDSSFGWFKTQAVWMMESVRTNASTTEKTIIQAFELHLITNTCLFFMLSPTFYHIPIKKSSVEGVNFKNEVCWVGDE